MKKIVLLVAIVAMLAAIAGPAAAAPAPDAGVLTGVAKVSRDVPSATTCGNGSTGLGLPGLTGGTGSYQLVTDPSSTPPGSVTGLVHGDGLLDVCGKLGPVAGVGAACGMSEGSAGTGSVYEHSLSDVKWPATAGGTLPVTGDVDTGDENLVAVVQAQGGAACANSSGATQFTVVGVWAVLS